MHRNRHRDSADLYAASRTRESDSGRTGREIYTGGYGRSERVPDTERDREQRFNGAWPAAERNRELEERSFFRDAVRPDYRGLGPRNFKRTDDRIADEVIRALTDAAEVDATHIEVHVENADVTLRGRVPSRRQKRLAADLAEWCFGVHNVFNQLHIEPVEHDEERLSDVPRR